MKLLQTSSAMESSTTGSYPQRPEQPDCAYYLRCGSCKYGANCRFNHPVLDRMVEKLHIASPLSDKGEHPDRPGQPDCQFYMKTGTCKFGVNCKYHHPHQQNGGFANGQPQLNFVGLPIRPGEKECAFYLRTGSCKFGAACKFHHPEPAPYGSMLPFSTSMYSSAVPASPVPVPYQSGFPSWQVNGAAYVPASGFPGSSAYMPVFVPPQQTISLSVWNAYQGQASFMPPPGGQQQAYAKPVYVGTSLQQADATAGTTDAQLASRGSSTGPNWHAKMNLPERQGQPDCHYFMKTGHCKFGANCRYHHPKIAALSTPVLSVMGLPLRPGMPVCTFYLKNGICKYGPTCKFDHPIGPEYVPPPAYTAPPTFPPTFPTVSSSSSIMSESLEGGSRDIITPGSSEESRDASKVEKEKVNDVLPSVKENGDCISTISVDDSKDKQEALAQSN